MKQQLINEIKNIPLYEEIPVAQAAEVIAGEGETRSEWQRMPNFRGIQIVGSNNVIAVVSDRYKLLQFSTVMLPYAEMFDGVIDYRLTHCDGSAILAIRPDGEEYVIDESQRLGVVVVNSVDRTASLVMKWCVWRGSRALVLPKKFGQFKNKHIGSVAARFKGHTNYVHETKAKWVLLLEKMKNVLLTPDVIAALVQAKIFNETFVKKHPDLEQKSLWEGFLVAYQDKVGAYETKLNRGKSSARHMEAELGKFTEALFTWALVFQV